MTRAQAMAARNATLAAADAQQADGLFLAHEDLLAATENFAAAKRAIDKAHAKAVEAAHAACDAALDLADLA